MTSAFQFVTTDEFPQMHQWAKMYAFNIQVKYDQVRSLLLRQPPVPDQRKDDAANWEKFFALITGRGGFGATEEEIR